MISVVIIDDENDLNECLSMYLELNSFNILGIGSNGKEAVELYKTFKPDVILIDHKMPEYDGNYAIKNIRNYNINAKIITISGSYEPSSDIPLRNRPNAFFRKPIKLVELKESIENLFVVKN